MKFFIASATAVLLTLSACDAPQSDNNEDDRTERGSQADENDDD
ncbi:MULTISPECIES: hypothetical protein [unclassified Sphingomonas]|nr:MULTISPECIES: hypothetical protein [unclassified Sphingomonas]